MPLNPGIRGKGKKRKGYKLSWEGNRFLNLIGEGEGGPRGEYLRCISGWSSKKIYYQKGVWLLFLRNKGMEKITLSGR